MKLRTIGIVGFGNLGSALHEGFTNAGIVTRVNNGSIDHTECKLQDRGIDLSHAASLEKMARECKVIFLAIKPKQLESVVSELGQYLSDDHIVISCLAMVDLEYIRYQFRHSEASIVKVMTTLGVSNCCGICAYQLDSFASYALKETVVNVLRMISFDGRVYELESEKQMQLFTIYIACMPGIIAQFTNQFNWRILNEDPKGFSWYTESLPDQLRSIADLIESAGKPNELWNKVATQGGVTRAMTDVLGKGGLSSLIGQAIEVGLERMNGGTK